MLDPLIVINKTLKYHFDFFYKFFKLKKIKVLRNNY
jgi:hypothetical protein